MNDSLRFSLRRNLVYFLFRGDHSGVRRRGVAIYALPQTEMLAQCATQRVRFRTFSPRAYLRWGSCRGLVELVIACGILVCGGVHFVGPSFKVRRVNCFD